MPNSLLNWLNELENRHSAPIQLGLDRIIQVGEPYGLFSFTCPVITVAGTNGKGSTLEILATLMGANNINYGLYTSPHLDNFNERIRINGQCVSDEVLCDAFSYIDSLPGSNRLTYFEFTTLAAFFIFQKNPLDVLLLEVGLGGRLDAVNTVAPDIAIITSISLDHEAWLGDSVEKIAAEKAGIIREKIPVVLSKEACLPPLLETVSRLQNEVYIEDCDFGYAQDEERWRFNNLALKLPKNYFPPNSVSIAFATYTILSNALLPLRPLVDVIDSLENKGMIGRCHCVQYNAKQIIFDVAHNPGGVAWLAKQIAHLPSKRKRFAVWASFKDKALESMVKPFLTIIDKWFVAGIEDLHRGSSSEELVNVLMKAGNLSAKDILVVNCQSIQDAFDSACKEASVDDQIIVFGSFRTVIQGYQAAHYDITSVNNGLIYRE